MTEIVSVVQENPTHLPSSPSTSSTNHNSHQQGEEDSFNNNNPSESDGLSLLAVLVAGFRKSLVVGCRERKRRRRRREEEEEEEVVFCCWGVDLDMDMDIGFPTNVRHVAHVTFDRFNGFLGLPVEFEPLVPRRAPSASAKVFGVSTESMQLSFDSRGNSVPTILLLMQRCLYAQGGLQAEGIFRINAENTQEENVRDQLNRGIIPEGIDVHCLAGLIKAWFRELPTGILDSLSPEQVMESQSEEECSHLVTLLPPIEAALLDWAINLMADVAQLEHLNKMNARNIAMVFAPNMTQMADPLTALMYAVKVMNFLKTLIVKTLKAREDSLADTAPIPHVEPSDENGPHSSIQPFVEQTHELNEQDEEALVIKEPLKDDDDDTTSETKASSFLTSIENIIIPSGNESSPDYHSRNGVEESGCKKKSEKKKSDLNQKKAPRKATVFMHKNRGNGGLVSRISSKAERINIEAWR